MADYDTNKSDGKIKTAVALKYDQDEDFAPRVVATGKGSFAALIIELARENDITIHEDADLVRILSILELNSLIPVEVYAVVGEIISYIYQQKNNQI